MRFLQTLQNNNDQSDFENHLIDFDNFCVFVLKQIKAKKESKKLN